MAQGFGLKIAWMAVKSDSVGAVVQSTGLTDFSPIGWNAGIKAACKNQLFVSPVLDGWVLAVGDVDTVLRQFFKKHQIPSNSECDLWPMTYYGMAEMSKIFSEIQFFYSHRVSGTYTYSKAVGEKIVRAYFIDLHSGSYHEIGNPSEIEIMHGATFIETFRGMSQDSPGEDFPAMMAGLWSINPHDFYEARWNWLDEMSGLIYNRETVSQRLEK